MIWVNAKRVRYPENEVNVIFTRASLQKCHLTLTKRTECGLVNVKTLNGKISLSI